MNINTLSIPFTLLLSTSLCYAGISFDGSIGSPSSTITNPQASKAYYSGVSASARFVAPFLEVGPLECSFDFIGKYVDLNNTANGSSQRETGNHIGLGSGLTVRVGKLYFGLDFTEMRARHFFVGNKNEYLEYEYGAPSTFIGLNYSFNNVLSAKLTYSQLSTQIKSSYTGLDTSSKYSENILWIWLSYDTGMGLGKFFTALFK